MAKDGKQVIKETVIASKIFTLRGERVMLDLHLAELYNVETRSLKQAVRRNMDRFPTDFMFELTENEINEVVSQNVIPSRSHLGGAVPFAFTENGVAMLSSVLKSKKAVEVNIAIMRTFTTIRRMLTLQSDLMKELGSVKSKLAEHDNNILLIFEYLKQFEETKHQHLEQANRRKIGYKTSNDEDEKI